MIGRDALRSMRRNLFGCFFYWLTFMLTTMLIFLFENIAMSAPQPTAATFGMSLSVGVMLLVVCVCSVDIFFANSFYVKSKAKEMAVRLICGATFFQIASFLLLQTLLLLALAIPAGIALSFAAMPIITNILLKVSGTFLAISVHGDAVFISSVILLFIIFWTVLLNLSFAYKNAAGMLMNTGTLLGSSEGSVLRIGLMSDKVQGILGLILFLVPLVLFYFYPEAMIVLTMLGMAGFYLLNKKGMTGWITDIIKRKISSPLKTAADGFLRRDFIVLNQNVLLFFMVESILVSLLIGHLGNAGDMAMLMVSYVLMTFLQSMSILFRFSSECSGRKKSFEILNALGYMENDQKKIISMEIIKGYGFIAAASLLYSMNMMGSYILHGNLSKSFGLALILIQVLPFVLWGILNRWYYVRSVYR